MPPAAELIRSRKRCIFLMLLTASCAATAAGQPPVGTGSSPPAVTVRETVDRQKANSVKAVYLYNFARFTTWPEHSALPDSEFRIGVLGQSGVTDSLNKVVSLRRTITDRRTNAVLPIRILQFDSAQAADSCHILFIGEGTSNEAVQTVLDRLNSAPVLVVCHDQRADDSQNAAVKFLLVDGTVRFRLDVSEAERRQLLFDAKLLTTAHEVIGHERITAGNPSFP